MEYTLKTGKQRYHESAVKALIYSEDSNLAPSAAGERYVKSTPWAVVDESSSYNYPSEYTMRKRKSGNCGKVGEAKTFDAEIYRKQIQANHDHKLEACKRAYQGAGSILQHVEAAASAPSVVATALPGSDQLFAAPSAANSDAVSNHQSGNGAL